MIVSVRQRNTRKHASCSRSFNLSPSKRGNSLMKISYLPNISNNSTCCSNSSSVTPPQSCTKFDDEEQNNTTLIHQDPLSCFQYNDFQVILPTTINGVKIQKVDWSYFSAQPNLLSKWKAHCFWSVGYDFDIKMKKMKKSLNIKYKLVITSWCCLSNKSWVKIKWDRLLEHETGHYLIGCLCALEFKFRADRFKYTNNYRMECIKLFQETFQQYLQLEKLYDEETHHSQNVVKQKQWNQFIKSELLKY